MLEGWHSWGGMKGYGGVGVGVGVAAGGIGIVGT